MEERVKKQRDFFKTNTTKSVDFRIEQLKKFKSILKNNESMLYEAIYKDFKKSKFDTYTTELALIYHDINEGLRKVKKWSKKKKARTNLVNFPAKSYVIPEPLGVSLVIGAWNYPYQLSLAPVVAAMIAGCTVILKPSELPSETSRVLAKLINNNFDPRYFCVVEGGVPETSALLEQKFDKIFFTGSVPVGKIIYQAAAKQLTPVTLELGGKSPAFITKSCNLKMSAKRLVWSKFLNSGQTCIAPDYILLDASIKTSFLKLVKEEIIKSQFSLENGNYVQIINDNNFERLVQMIDPDKVFHGGKFDKKERFIEPTVLTDVSFNDEIMKDEIFGPILPIITYDNFNEILLKVKELPSPLSCYVFTNDKSEKEAVLNQLPFGGGAVNDAVMHITNPNLDFGGVGDSGIGAYHGKAGFDSFSHNKSILDKPTWLEMSLKYFPQTEVKFKWISRFLK